jgi:hypothetical protein
LPVRVFTKICKRASRREEGGGEAVRERVRGWGQESAQRNSRAAALYMITTL